MNPVVTIIANPVNVLLSTPTINVQLASAGPQGATGSSGGLPAGGTTGQVATKRSNADYDIDWESVAGGGGSSAWGSITGTLSSQTDLQSAFNAKANSSSLATVATTGAYSDLSGKPTLGTASTHAATDFALSSTTVNGHALSANVTVTTSDVGLGSVTNDAQLKIASNLSDVNNGATARSNLGVAAVGGSYLGDTLTSAQTITLVEYAPYAFTINSLRNLGTVSGTVSGTLKINGTAVTGCSSLSLTSTPQNVTASGANSVSVGNTITFVTASASSLTGLLPFSLIGTR
jgi:hypothetical protein